MHGVSGIHVDDVAEHQSVEQHAPCGEVLLDRGQRELALKLIDECRDVGQLGGDEFPDAARVAPVRRAPRGIYLCGAFLDQPIPESVIKRIRRKLAK